jgi:endonuclease/exonuclease/phosphatase family metal-dependent hydrolase
MGAVGVSEAGGLGMITVGTWNLENLFRPGGDFGPDDAAVYRAKLVALAATINAAAPDVLGVQEVGQPEALADLVALLDGSWHTALSGHFDVHHPIRVGVLSRHPLRVIADTAAFVPPLAPIQGDDDPQQTVNLMGRGVLAVQVRPSDQLTLTFLTAHLKSKLLSFPGGPGGASRFAPRDEGERARYAAYALYRRTAEAVTVRAVVDQLLGDPGAHPNLVLVGDLNDQPQVATTQILYGSPGSQIGTAAFDRPDRGDRARLWNLAPLIPEQDRYSRIYQGQPELIDHVLVNHALVGRVAGVRTVTHRPLPSVGDDPETRRSAHDSDHAPIFANLDL